MTAPARQLARRELEALHLVAAGATHSEAARQLVMTPKGFTATVNRAMRKLGARNAPHAVLLACRAGILDGRPQRHGDHAGYVAHTRRGEDPKNCQLGCPEGEKTYRDGLKAAKQGQQRLSAPVSRPLAAQLGSATPEPPMSAQAPTEPRSHANAA